MWLYCLLCQFWDSFCQTLICLSYKKINYCKIRNSIKKLLY